MRKLFLLLLLLPSALRADGIETFLWDKANAAMARAATEDEFLEGARLYRSLLDRDRNRPAILRNYGTALLLSGQPEKALDAYLRAERLAGSDPLLLHDIRAATAAMDPAADSDGAAPSATDHRSRLAPLPWTRSVFPWHYRVPVRLRLIVSAASWAVFWIFLPFRRRRIPKGILVLCAVAFALFASSAVLSLLALAAPLP